MNSKQNMILKKESIQLQVPLQLPCYDFTTIINNTVKISTRVEHQQVFFVSGTFYVKTQINVFFEYNSLSECDGRCVQGLDTNSP